MTLRYPVSVGISRDTAQFAVASISAWWAQLGAGSYPDATTLTITADSGGSNSARGRLWKTELQKLADQTGLTIRVLHFPPGTSKWNRIEHRLFSFISHNWGVPLPATPQPPRRPRRPADLVRLGRPGLQPRHARAPPQLTPARPGLPPHHERARPTVAACPKTALDRQKHHADAPSTTLKAPPPPPPTNTPHEHPVFPEELVQCLGFSW
jgi:hypothetical protein